MTLNELAAALAEEGKTVVLGSNKMKIALAIEIDALVVLRTPVDTGRARANWQVGLETSPTDQIVAVDKDGGGVHSKNESAMRGAQPGQAIFLANNVEYIDRLNDGWSAQAPAGYIEVCITEAIGKAKDWKIER